MGSSPTAKLQKHNSIAKTHAKTTFCLTDSELANFDGEQRTNPRSRNGPPMTLFPLKEVEKFAWEKWGGQEGVEAERSKRAQKRAAAATARAEPASKAQKTENKPDGTSSPISIQERIRVLKPGKEQCVNAGDCAEEQQKPCVLYWMNTAIRAHENPALEVAASEAAKRGAHLVIAAFLLSTDPYLNARRAQFMLEGLKEVQGTLREVGVGLLVHIDGMPSSTGDRSDGWAELTQLASRCELVVAEDMPTPVEHSNVRKLQAALPEGAALWAVDTACIVPAQLIKQRYEKCWAYRSRTQGLRAARFALYGPTGEQDETLTHLKSGSVSAPTTLATPTVDLTDSPIATVLAEIPWLDNSVKVAKQMPGGSAAGYARWDQFKLKSLTAYSSQRNQFMKRNGVSRMSAYNRWGMVSPWRIAREARAAGGAGPSEKYLDEFCIWRELSYCWALQNVDAVPGLDKLSLLPSWAQKSLSEHEHDQREVKTREQLEKCRSGDEVWDAMQHQLNTTGELHNNLRMTWGKAFIRWAPTVEESMRTAIHLNNKYGLDGGDPSSYTGVLGSFGLFDRPKGKPSTPIYGSVAMRSSASVQKRIGGPLHRYRDLKV